MFGENLEKRSKVGKGRDGGRLYKNKHVENRRK